MGNADLAARQAEVLKGATPATVRAIGANPREVIEQRIEACKRDIRKIGFELIEWGHGFAKNPELQEFAQPDAKKVIELAHELAAAIDAMKENNDELDAL